MPDFRKELTDLINTRSLETESNTPDFVLAEYLEGCLNTFDKAVNKRSDWYAKRGVNEIPFFYKEKK